MAIITQNSRALIPYYYVYSVEKKMGFTSNDLSPANTETNLYFKILLISQNVLF
jgi:hypothetical protein